MNLKLSISKAKLLNPLASMPLCPIDPKVDKSLFEPSKKAMKQFQRAFSIPFGPLHHPMQPMERSHPAKEIQSFLMLTSCVNVGLTPPLCPHPTQFRMKREPRLIFKKDHSSSFASFHLLKFFLTLAETPPPLPQKLE